MKKVLSFVLILALVLGSFSFAFGLSDIEGSANSEAIEVANDLGIVKGFPDGSFMPEKAVNRAEFAAMITRALAIPDSALAAYTSTSFKDTSGYGWAVPYLAFCQSKGIMIGDGFGNVMPGRTISVNEAITMAARAIGYTENSAMLVGTWPSNYVTLGQTLGLYTDVATATTISRESAAQVIYNSLTVPLVTVNADGDTKTVRNSDNTADMTLLTAGLGATASTTPEVVKENDPSKINLTKYVGAYAVKYKKDNKIIAIGEVKSTFLTVDKVDTGSFKTADGTKYYATAALATTDRALFTNGKYIGVTKVALAPNETIAVDLSGNTVNKIYSSSFWTVSDHFVYDTDSLAKEDIAGNKFKLTDSDMIDYDAFRLLGASSLDAIPEDAVVYVYNAGTGTDKYVSKIVVGTKTVKGIVTKKSKVDSVDNYFIGDVAYTIATDPTLTVSIDVGSEGTASLDYYGNIYKYEETDAAANNYAMVIDKGSLANAYGDTTYSVKLALADGTEVEYACADVATATPAASKLNKYEIVKFALNASGKVKEISNITSTTDGALSGNAISATIIGTTPLAPNAVIWTYDSVNEVYVLKKAADLDSDKNIINGTKVSAYVKEGKIVAMYADKSYFGGTDDIFGVINEEQLAYYAKDETNYPFMVGQVDGKDYRAFISSTTTAIVSTTASGLGLKVLSVDSDGFVKIAAPSVGSAANNNIWSQKELTTGAVTVAGIQDRMVKVYKADGVNFDYYSLATNAVVYAWDKDAEAFLAVNPTTSVFKGKNVHLYQTKEKTAGYDILIVW